MSNILEHLSPQELERSKSKDVLLATVRHSGSVADLQQRNVDISKAKLPSCSLEIQTCGSLYEKWKSKKRMYRRAPKDGVTMNVDYVDTKELNPITHDPAAPVVLTLHGAPGTYDDFAPLAHDLVPHGARIISPNFPGNLSTF